MKPSKRLTAAQRHQILVVHIAWIEGRIAAGWLDNLPLAEWIEERNRSQAELDELSISAPINWQQAVAS